jgi:MFS family permease
LVLIAFTVPLTTLNATAAALQAVPGAQAWIMNAMSVGAAAGLLSSGAIGDDVGRRRVFVAGALLLAVASGLAAMAPTATLLILARVLQGLGGAAILACGLGLVGHVFPAGAARARATGVWAAAIGAGVATGPVLAAALADLGGWRLPHLATALGGGALAAAAWTILPESRSDRRRRVDVPGTLLIGAGLTAVLSGLVEVRGGWNGTFAPILLTGGAALMVAFVAAERRTPDPMLDLALFRRPDFVGATVAAFAAGAGILSLMSFVPTLLERAMGVDAGVAGAMLVAWSGTSVVTAFGVRWLPASIGPRALLVVGLVGAAAGQLGLIGLGPGSPIGRILPALLIAGLAYGVLNAALGRQAVASVPADRTAMGSGANNTARFVGSSVGLTIVTLLVTGSEATRPAALLSGWTTAAAVTAGVSMLGAFIVLLAREQSRQARPAVNNRADGAAENADAQGRLAD